MALILVEGFDSFASGSGSDIGATLSHQYIVSNTADAFKSFTGRDGGLGMRIQTSSTLHWLYMTPPGRETHETWTVGFAFLQPAGGLATTGQFIRFAQLGQGGTADSIGLRVGTNNLITVRDGGDSILATTANDVFTPGTWCYIEFQATCNATVGSFELRVDGVNVASDSGIDTDYGGSAEYAKVMVTSPGNVTYAPAIDDLYVCDGSGSTNNDFLGECYVRTLSPNTDNGPNDGTPSTAGSHYILIDEFPPSGTDYISLTANADREMYGYDNLVESWPIVGAQLSTIYSNRGASGAKLKSVMKSGTSEVASTPKAVQGGYYSVGHEQVSETNPDTAAEWTASEINSGVFGYELET